MADMRYVTSRVRHGGKAYYWQRRGYPLARLPDDPEEREREATRLNMEADNASVVKKAEPHNTKGTVAWCVHKYKATERYETLAESTKGYYDRHLANIVRAFGAISVDKLSRQKVIEFIESHSISQQRHVAAVLSNVISIGRRYDLTNGNQAEKLALPTPKPRQEVWDTDQIRTFVSAAKEHEHARPIIVAFFTMLFTAQRPGDVLRLTRDRVFGGSIILQQQKTDAWVDIPVHKRLEPVLSYAFEVPSEYLVCDNDGNPVSRSTFQYWTSAIRESVGLGHMQMRDLRRTAIVIMGEAGLAPQQISAISGHSIATVEHIMRVYMPRTRLMAETAIRTWEQAEIGRLYKLDVSEFQNAASFSRSDQPKSNSGG